MSNRYYSNSKPVRWIREKIFKIEKPTSLGWGQWGVWEEEVKKRMPVRYFFTEALPDLLEKIPEYTIDHIKNVGYYITNRRHFSHGMRSDLKKGEYHSFNNVLLHSMFCSFIDFIEIEEAYSHIAWSKEEDIKKYNLKWYHRSRIVNWVKHWRCPQAGIDHLLWEMKLDVPDPTDPSWYASPAQAAAAREKMALYTWWKDIRSARGDSWDASGFSAFWKQMDEKYGDSWLVLGGKGKLTAAEKRTYAELSEVQAKLDEQWDAEDEQMMIRLIKLRNNLWT